MSNKTFGIFLIIAGILIVVVSLFSGYIGLSASHVISLKKELLAALGAIAVIVGIVLMVR